MERTRQRLTSLFVQRATEERYYHDGGGLYLRVTATGAKGWIYRYSVDKKSREMGLGPFPAISLAAARASASEARALVKAGKDPINARETQRAALRLQAARDITFEQAARIFIDTQKSEWRNAKHADQWLATLETYAFPVLGNLSVAAVSGPDVLLVLDPIWESKRETASRVRGRIENILDWAKARHYRDGDNPARLSILKYALKGGGKKKAVKHHAAVAFNDVAAVSARLCGSAGIAALALRFCILTGARAGEVTGAGRAEIDLAAAVWTVPADRIKAGREHRVPLSKEALAIAAAMLELPTTTFLFPGWRTGGPLSLTSLTKALNTAGGAGKTVHGFRSSFKEWGRANRHDRELTELSLAHLFGSAVERAYGREDLLEERRPLMQAWATFATATRAPAEVIQFPTTARPAEQAAA